MTHPTFVVTDFETTGHAPKEKDRIIHASFVIIENKTITYQYTSFFNPERSIPPFIEELTGISDEMVKNAPFFHEAAKDILPLLDGAVFVAHNVLFDLQFLQGELERAGYSPFTGPAVDTVELARIIWPTSDSFKLGDLTKGLGLVHDRPHQADSDAYVTAQMLIMMIEKLEQMPLATLEKLGRLAVGLKSDAYVLIQAIIEEKQHHVEQLPSHLEVYRGLALRKKEVKEREKAHSHSFSYPKEESEKEALFSAFPRFERRSGQWRMMDLIYDSMRTSVHLAVEAGTGTGKSIGYLLPAIYESKRTGEPVIVSTHTVILQQQLLKNDMEKLKQLLPFSVTSAVLKGRSHYIDLYKFSERLKEPQDNYDYVLAKMQILIWLLETETGDVDELNLSSGGELFWNEIRQDGDYMNKGRKAWLDKDFYIYAKKQAQQADIVITNHSFLASDLTAQSSVFPSYSHVIIDEAHHFERVARERLGLFMDQVAYKQLLGRLGTYEQEELVVQIDELLAKYEQPLNKDEQLGMNRQLQQLHFESDEWFKTLHTFFSRHTKKRAGHWSKRQVRLTSKVRSLADWQPVEYGAERLDELLTEVEGWMRRKEEALNPFWEQMSAAEQAKVDQFKELIHQWKHYQLMLERLIFRPEEDEVIWMEGDSRSLANTFAIRSSPLEAGGLIKEALLDKKHVVFTSATLTVNGSFQFFTEESGLSACEHQAVTLPSPFDFQKNCRMVIPDDVPEIKHVPQDEYVEALANYLTVIAESAKGRMLVLFTAFDMMKKTYELIRESGLLEEYILLAQGITNGSRTRLTRNFQRFDKAILFGTNSFWEGIDVPGEDLSCLVMVRLPFSPPDEPFIEAKSEKLEERGGNPFSDYSLPQAVLRFKQGFGRLIRSSTDRGMIIVFDRRIQTSAYGRTFLQSIPDIPIEEASLDETALIVENWLQLSEE
ncbi:ATP-dependent DNA helicase DinG [Bacillus thermotolerans]|uniref:3'-5' exonuclease DinG n=2 Tax=Bacillus thermotolerans TaxID=1221996 RepID=A0A0F5HZ38_BACTR|nr:ATP-dependent DNA helicase DinG [Bacillus thermotolerans]KKB37668.1 DinG family ATP-dependent helicase YoaA [Bacillus thermotolerans]KKB38483.1 DinG family ATP-dependent helicase YoaA [Bacillus thermotolerans]